MAKVRTLRARITELQYKRLKFNAESRGFLTLSNYVRFVLFNHDLLTEKLIVDIHNQICNKKTK